MHDGPIRPPAHEFIIPDELVSRHDQERPSITRRPASDTRRRDWSARRPRGRGSRTAPLLDITGVIGRRLNVPVLSRPPEEAAGHFGWFALFAALDVPASSALTRERLGWQPKKPGLISDLDRSSYFGGSSPLA